MTYPLYGQELNANRKGTAGRLPLVLRYPGSKQRLAPWIAAHFPIHRVYVEPFCGSLSVFFAKSRSPVEVVNDRDERVVNLFRVLREHPDKLLRAIEFTPYARSEFGACEAKAEDPVEDARRLLVRCWQSVGNVVGVRSGWRGDHRAHTPTALIWSRLPERLAAVVERLKGVHLECQDALTLLGKRNAPDTLYYCDPPYLISTRSRRLYQEEFSSEGEHRELIDLLKAKKGHVLLSGYDSPHYQELLPDWRRVTHRTLALTGEARCECLWLNPKASRSIQPSLWEED